MQGGEMIVSAQEFISLRDSENFSDYSRAASEEAPNEVWLEVISSYPDYRKWVAHNKTVPIEILEHLCEFDAEVRYFVAMKRKLPLQLFLRLAADTESVVRLRIASNKKAPMEVLDVLARDQDDDVARVAQSNIEKRS
jgi:hypothetical protein